MASLSIVIPAYNEEARLPQTLAVLTRYLSLSPFQFREIIVVDDGSSDRTVEVAEQHHSDQVPVRVLRNPGNRGKGYSVRHGILASRADWTLFTDADLSVPIEDINRLFKGIETTVADIAIGSRGLDRSLIGIRQPKLREYSGRFFNFVMRLVVGLPFRDTQCGFKLYRTSVAQEIFKTQLMAGFSFDVEHLSIARHQGIPIVEVPVRWNNVLGTKVSTLQGIQSFVDLIRIRWNHLTGKYT